MGTSRRVLLLFAVAIWNPPDRGMGGERVDESAFSVTSIVAHKLAFDRPHDIELQGDLAFIPGKGGSIAIVDVAQPDSPRIVWHQHDPRGLDDAETVLLIDNWLFLGTNDFISIDIRDPRRPVFEEKLSKAGEIAHINGMVRRGDTILAVGKSGFLAAYDVSDPASPTLAGAVNVRKEHDIRRPHDVDLFAAYAVIAAPRRFGRAKESGRLALFQVFDHDRGQLLPPERWKLTGLAATEELLGANRVQVSGHYAFVGASASGEGGRLIVVDLSESRSPRQVAWLPFAPQDGWGPNGLTVAGQVVFLAGGQSVEAIDVSRPEQPVKLASQRFTDQLRGGEDSGHDLVYRDGYLYVTGQNDHCLIILRVESESIRQLAE